ncbi:MAG TPA: hypothetical protein VGO37_06095 [Steroidobacteraceae bacterium]|nr:hypothetical protein [Steroidobacteraceae bacterium]
MKWLKGIISRKEYFDAAFALTVWFEASSRKISDLDMTNPSIFDRMRALVDRHNIDVSDAFQILSVTAGYFSRLANDSRTLLVTADQALAIAADKEGIRSWYCLTPVFGSIS